MRCFCWFSVSCDPVENRPGFLRPERCGNPVFFHDPDITCVSCNSRTYRKPLPDTYGDIVQGDCTRLSVCSRTLAKNRGQSLLPAVCVVTGFGCQIVNPTFRYTLLIFLSAIFLALAAPSSSTLSTIFSSRIFRYLACRSVRNVNTVSPTSFFSSP